MDALALVTALWDAFDRAAFEEALPLLHHLFQAEWPGTRERFTSRETFVAANRAYPGRWRIRVERLQRLGEGAVSVVEVTSAEEAGPRFHAVSFFETKDGFLSRLTEYWGDCGEPPTWRRAFAERY
jgi:hypothetical protein